MTELLTENLWETLTDRYARHDRLRAAIAYVTTAHIPFVKGDLLVCDASDTAIRHGSTAVTVLDGFVQSGAEVYSYEGLHAKVALIDGSVLVGSANMSANAGIGTLEASILTSDREVVQMVTAFIEELVSNSVRVSAEFIERAKALEVVVLPQPPTRKQIQVAAPSVAPSVRVEFRTRRQNTNKGEAQFRIWITRTDSDKLAQHLPDLAIALRDNRKWKELATITWRNGHGNDKMTFAAYEDQAGETAFTASKRTPLFDFAARRQEAGTEDEPFIGTCHIARDGHIESIDLDLEL